MKKYKVIYHIGDKIEITTNVESGFVIFENEQLTLISKTGDFVSVLSDISQVSLFMMNGLGSMLKIETKNRIIFLCAVRFCIAGQFAMGNAIVTRKLKTLLESQIVS